MNIIMRSPYLYLKLILIFIIMPKFYDVIVYTVTMFQYAFPTHQRGVHLVNISRFFETLFPIFKRFAPADELWQKVYFHGYDITSLHR